MITGTLLSAHPAIDTGRAQPRSQLRIQQQVVDAQSGIARPVLAEVIPECIDPGVIRIRT